MGKYFLKALQSLYLEKLSPDCFTISKLNHTHNIHLNFAVKYTFPVKEKAYLIFIAIKNQVNLLFIYNFLFEVNVQNAFI